MISLYCILLYLILLHLSLLCYVIVVLMYYTVKFFTINTIPFCFLIFIFCWFLYLIIFVQSGIFVTRLVFSWYILSERMICNDLCLLWTGILWNLLFPWIFITELGQNYQRYNSLDSPFSTPILPVHLH